MVCGWGQALKQLGGDSWKKGRVLSMWDVRVLALRDAVQAVGLETMYLEYAMSWWD